MLNQSAMLDEVFSALSDPARRSMVERLGPAQSALLTAVAEGKASALEIDADATAYEE